MSVFRQQDNQLIWELNRQIVQIEPWGRDSLRVRATIGPAIHTDLPQALLDPPPAAAAIDIGPDQAVIRRERRFFERIRSCHYPPSAG